MSEQRVFCNGQGDPMPIYLQEDAAQLDFDRLRVLIQDYGGAVINSPENAVVIVIINRQTPLAVNLINQRSRDVEQEIVSQGVVRHEWILDCIMHRGMQAPPGWGGHYLRRHTIDNFFPAAFNVSIQSNPSAATIADAMYPPSTQPEPSTQLVLRGSATSAISRSIPGPSRTQALPQSQPSESWTLQIASSAPNSAPIAPVNPTSNQTGGTGLLEMPPSPPPKHTRVKSATGHLYTELDDQFINKYICYAKRNGLRYRQHATYEAISKLMPWHTAISIASRLTRKPELALSPTTREFAAPNINHPAPSIQRTTGTTHIGQGTRDIVHGPRPRKQTFRMPALSPLASRELGKAALPATEEQDFPSVRRRKGGRGTNFTQEEFDAMVQHLAHNPQAFFYPSPFVSEDLPPKSRSKIWKEFEAMHPIRNDKCWLEYHRRKSKELEAAANILIERTMQEAIFDDDTGSPSEPTLTDTAGDLRSQAKSGDSSLASSSTGERMFRHTSVSSEVREISTDAGLSAVAGNKRSRFSASDAEQEDDHWAERAKGKEKPQVWTVLDDEDDYGWD